MLPYNQNKKTMGYIVSLVRIRLKNRKVEFWLYREGVGFLLCKHTLNQVVFWFREARVTSGLSTALTTEVLSIKKRLNPLLCTVLYKTVIGKHFRYEYIFKLPEREFKFLNGKFI